MAGIDSDLSRQCQWFKQDRIFWRKERLLWHASHDHSGDTMPSHWCLDGNGSVVVISKLEDLLRASPHEGSDRDVSTTSKSLQLVLTEEKIVLQQEEADFVAGKSFLFISPVVLHRDFNRQQ
jgi:hypothetical protein